MISYEEWLQEIIPKNKQDHITREELYKQFMPGLNPRDAYEQQERVMKCNRANGVYPDVSQKESMK